VPGPDDVILASRPSVCAAAICTSGPSSHSWQVNYPVVLGHEFGGRIAELGSAVTAWKEGDRVVSETAAVINADSPMSRARSLQPRSDRKGFGYGVDGAMTVRAGPRALPASRAGGLSMEFAALTEPCCVAYNAVIQNARITPGDRVMVLGPGPIGILCAAMARLAGAGGAGGTRAGSGPAGDRPALRLRSDRGRCHRLGKGARWARRGWRDRCGGGFGIAEDGLELVRPGRLDQQGGLGPAAAGISRSILWCRRI
jgi:L-iditol 2-dehydrogenase